MWRSSLIDLISGAEGTGVESRPMSLGAVLAMSLICGVIGAAIGYDRGRGLRDWFLLLTRVDETVIGALIRLDRRAHV